MRNASFLNLGKKKGNKSMPDANETLIIRTLEK